MAIRSTTLGGSSNWSDSQTLTAADLNDTFDAAINQIRTNPCFWLSTFTSQTFDNFNSYTAGNTLSGTYWTTTISSGGTATIVTSAEATGVGPRELLLNCPSDSDTAQVVSVTLTANRHYYAPLYFTSSRSSGGSASGDGHLYVSLDNFATAYEVAHTNFQDDSSSTTTVSSLLVIARGINTYDAYIGGRKALTSTSVSALRIGFQAASGAVLTTCGAQVGSLMQGTYSVI
jgi:hypothetical protein